MSARKSHACPAVSEMIIIKCFLLYTVHHIGNIADIADDLALNLGAAIACLNPLFFLSDKPIQTRTQLTHLTFFIVYKNFNYPPNIK